ncbi:MAG: oligoendopeptidase F [Firmicutes bacterium]|jgi:oligoendopeptidase F|nr:oligoendopeptidase F [Bacillota bacterium]
MNAHTDGRLPTRAEIPNEYKWRLEDLFPSDDAWEKAFAAVEETLPKISAFKGRLGQGSEQLLAALRLRDQMEEQLLRAYAYAQLRKDEDTTDSRYQQMSSRALSLVTQAYSTLAFVNPEILAIPTETLQAFLEENAALQIYRHTLEDLIRRKPHVLSETEEELLARFTEVAQSAATIFEMINDADMKFGTVTDEEGRPIELTKGRYIRLMESRDRRVRRDAFKTLYTSYINQRNTIAATLYASVKKDCLYAQLRHYDSSLHAALDDDNIPVAVYDNLLTSVQNHLDLMHRYVSLRKRMLGVDQVHMYDLYVPLVREVDMRFSYPQAQEIVKTAMAPLGADYVGVLDTAFRSAWIDVYENAGKTSGAYSWGVYGVHPYILLNFQETLDDVFTLAHEMGHALHSYYSSRKQPFVYAGYSIFLAEIASTLNENLVAQYLLQTLEDRQQRMYIINHILEQFRTTVYRQTMFAEFERIIHARVERGEVLTADNLCSLYRELNRKYYGDEIVLDAEIDMEWARIPHFYRSFYVYQYATGYSAAMALAKQIQDEGPSAVERYLDFLSSGSSDYPLELLKAAGVDMSTPQPIDQALGVFASLLDQLEDHA